MSIRRDGARSPRGPSRSGPWRSRARASARKTIVLDRLLVAAQRGEAHQFLRESDLLDEAGLDRGDDVVAKGGIEGHECAIVSGGPPPHPIARAGTSPAAGRMVSSRPWRQRRARDAPSRGHVGETRPRHALGEVGGADAAAAGGLARRFDAIAAADLAEPRDELELRRGAGKAGLEPAVKRAADLAGAGQLEAGKTDSDRGRRKRAAVERLGSGRTPPRATRSHAGPARTRRGRASP